MAKIRLTESQLKKIIKEAVDNTLNAPSEPGQETLQQTQDSTGDLEKYMMGVAKWYRKASFSNDIVKAQYYLDKLGTSLNGLFKLLEKEYGAPHVEKAKPKGF